MMLIESQMENTHTQLVVTREFFFCVAREHHDTTPELSCEYGKLL